MNVMFQKRNFTALPELILQYTVERYSFDALLGPLAAVIPVHGDELELWQLVDRVRCPVKIYSDLGDCTWWGFAAEIKLNLGAWDVGVSIDSMHNAVAVAYQDENNAGQTTRTAFALDAQSIGEYGRREILLTTNGSNQTHAEAARAAALARMRYPTPVITPAASIGEVGGVIYCRGWGDTLGWTYYDNNYGREEYAPSGSSAAQNLGDVAANTRLAQSFQLDNPWTAKSVSVRIMKIGAPADNFVAALYAADGAGGTPGTLLGSGTLAGTAVGTSSEWTDITLSAGVALSASTVYWLVLSRSGAVDPANYYVAEVSEDLGYADGAFYLHDGANYDPRVPDADLLFRVLSTMDTAIQADGIGQAAEFISGVDRGTFTSGILTQQYRDGYATGAYELNELLWMGTSNSRRMLAPINEARRMRIQEEPASNTAPYLLQRDGSLHDASDSPVRNELCPVGIWTRLKEVIPPSLSITRLADPSKMFIEQSEYEAASKRLILTPRGVQDIFEFGVQDG